jgi:hypothetical protein
VPHNWRLAPRSSRPQPTGPKELIFIIIIIIIIYSTIDSHPLPHKNNPLLTFPEIILTLLILLALLVLVLIVKDDEPI